MKKERFGYALLSFLITPILALFLIIGNYQSKFAKYIVVIFFGIFGFNIIFQPGFDGYRHSLNVERHYVGLSMGEFFDELANILMFAPESETNDDPYLHIISYISSFFSSGSSGLYLIAGLVYGYFFASGIQKVYLEIGHKWTFITILLFLIFLSWMSFNGLNSIRNWTAAWIFFNGAYAYFKTRKRKYILLILSTIFFHFAYALIIISFFVVLLIGRRPIIYLMLLIPSYFYNLDISQLQPFIGATQLSSSKFNAYSKNDDEISARIESRTNPNVAFHKAYFLKTKKYFSQLLFFVTLLLFGYFRKNYNHDYLLASLANIGIILIVLANISYYIPVFQNRLSINSGFYMMSYVVIVYSRFMIWARKDLNATIFKSIVIVGIPVIGFLLYTNSTMIGNYTDIRMFISPLLYPFLGDESLSVKEFLRDAL